MSYNETVTCLLGFAALLIVCPGAAGQVASAPPTAPSGQAAATFPAGKVTAKKLGAVFFPTSCETKVQPEFEKGVALLHSFQYSIAEAEFTDVARRDPGCAMAYWGEAMSIYYPIWEHPSEATLREGRQDLAKTSRLSMTARERGYIAAAQAFYQDKAPNYRVRTIAFSAAMEKLHENFPHDGEAATFFALSLLGIPAEGADKLANRKKAMSVLESVLATQPNHPGAVHYMIHAADTPDLAPQGLDAARRYAKIAPDSAHALHMPSHIFVRLGLWQEAIDSNVASSSSAARATRLHEEDASYQLHAMGYLQYAYLQAGRNSDAQHVMDEVKDVPGSPAERLSNFSVELAVRYAMENHDWAAAAALTAPADATDETRATIYMAQAIGAARSGDPAKAQDSLGKYQGAEAARLAQEHKEGAGGSSEIERSAAEQETEAWVLYAQGKHDDAVKMLQAAAETEKRKGAEDLTMPAEEMLGDLLLDVRQHELALAAYEAALEIAPNRFNSLYGAAQAASLAGEKAKAKEYSARLVESCGALGERRELLQARALLPAK
jgi:tetratricopeptide (TPR) repeat protein